MLATLYLFLLYINNAIILPGFFCCAELISFIVQNKTLNLWNTNCWILLKVILGIRHVELESPNKIEKGFILCNHRSIFDIPFDPYVTKSTTVGRIGACLFGNLASLLGIFSGRGVWFSRGRTDRTKLMTMLLNKIDSGNSYNKTMLFYPEGSRKSYKTLECPDELKLYIKKGLLKSIYEHNKLPVQMYISSNKDYPMSLKLLQAKYGIVIVSKYSIPIYPDDYETFDLFIDKICNEWYKLWFETHSHVFSIDRKFLTVKNS